MRKSIHLLLVFTINVGALCVGQTSDSLKTQKFLDGKVSVAGKTKGGITKEEFLNSKGLLLNDSLASIYHITSFKMTLVAKGSKLREFINKKDNMLLEKMHTAVKNASAGSKIYFEFIKCSNKNNSIYSLYPLEFVLK